ncbi:hypothetical protein ACP0HM_27330 [Escherichia coli]
MPELKLTGNVKQNKVNVDGTLKRQQLYAVDDPVASSGTGAKQCRSERRAGVKDLNLDATINAPGLDNALPGLGGTAKGLVKVRGTVEAPQLLADITARGLRWQELSVAQVRVEGDIKSTDQIAGKLDVRVEQISQPDVNINLVTLNAKRQRKAARATVADSGRAGFRAA